MITVILFLVALFATGLCFYLLENDLRKSENGWIERTQSLEKRLTDASAEFNRRITNLETGVNSYSIELSEWKSRNQSLSLQVEYLKQTVDELNERLAYIEKYPPVPADPHQSVPPQVSETAGFVEVATSNRPKSHTLKKTNGQ